MRIISQDGKFDLPYEQTAIIADRTMIYAVFHGVQKLIAMYSSQEKTRKVMEWLHGRQEEVIFRFPQDNKIEVDS